MKLLNASTPALLLAGCTAIAVAAEPPMEKRILFGPESARQWSAAESSLQASTARTRNGQPVLHWHIAVDYFAGEVKYPIGWPRINLPLKEASARDWSGWDYLQMWVYTDATGERLPQDPVGLALQTPDKEGAYNRSLTELRKGEWVPIRIPLAQVPRHQDVRTMQFHISESKYRHQDQLDFYFDEIALLRYAQPAVLDFTPENAVVFADAKEVPVRFNLAGVKPGESVEVRCELLRDGKVVAETTGKTARGPQRVVLKLIQGRLDAGNYELAARVADRAEAATARLRLVESPWK